MTHTLDLLVPLYVDSVLYMRLRLSLHVSDLLFVAGGAGASESPKTAPSLGCGKQTGGARYRHVPTDMRTQEQIRPDGAVDTWVGGAGRVPISPALWTPSNTTRFKTGTPRLSPGHVASTLPDRSEVTKISSRLCQSRV